MRELQRELQRELLRELQRELLCELQRELHESIFGPLFFFNLRYMKGGLGVTTTLVLTTFGLWQPKKCQTLNISAWRIDDFLSKTRSFCAFSRGTLGKKLRN